MVSMEAVPVFRFKISSRKIILPQSNYADETELLFVQNDNAKLQYKMYSKTKMRKRTNKTRSALEFLGNLQYPRSLTRFIAPNFVNFIAINQCFRCKKVFTIQNSTQNRKTISCDLCPLFFVRCFLDIENDRSKQISQRDLIAFMQ